MACGERERERERERESRDSRRQFLIRMNLVRSEKFFLTIDLVFFFSPQSAPPPLLSGASLSSSNSESRIQELEQKLQEEMAAR